MTTEKKLIRSKVGLLQVARIWATSSQACRMMGYSRESFYRLRQLYEK